MGKHASPYGGAAVKRGLFAFLAGRGVSAGLTFAAFSLSAHALSLSQYGIYAAALALMELLLALCTGGIDWVAARVLPESRMHASGRATAALVLRLFALQSAIYASSAVLVWLLAAPLSQLLRLPEAAPAFALAAGLLWLEGVGRLSRDQMLGILMEQRSGQLAQILRSGTLLAALLWLHQQQLVPTALDVLRLELLASALAALLGALLLARALWRLLPLAANDADWRMPPLRSMARLAFHTYASYLLAIAYGPQVLTMVIARLLGTDAVAVFGLARGFADQVRRYLPTDLLQSVIRPALIAYYTTQHDFQGLMLRLALWFKAALLVLFPLLLFFAAFGALGMQAIGGRRFADAWPIVLLLLCGTAMAAWRRVVELAANTVLASDLTVKAALVLMGVPLLIAGGLAVLPWLLPAVALVALSDGVFCWRVMRGLRGRGHAAHWELAGFGRLLLAWLAALAVLLGLRAVLAPGLPLALLLAAGVSLAALVLARPLSQAEAQLVSGWNARLARWMSFQRKV